VTENPKNINFCPFWKRVSIYGNKVLALCGSETPDSGSEFVSDVGSSQTIECPYSMSGYAFPVPAIIQVNLPPYYDHDIMAQPIHAADLSGAPGIAQLELRWEREVEKFLKRNKRGYSST